MKVLYKISEYQSLILPVIFLLCSAAGLQAQPGTPGTTKALFIGNSYTYVNDLPGLLEEMSLTTGDTILTDNSTPGGYTFRMHCTNNNTCSKISQGGWDFVVLQEQSQLPALPDSIVESETFPYARKLDSMIVTANPCAVTVFYRTWGRKNGDSENCSNWPPVCTYEGMDSLLHSRYTTMSDENSALLSPVGTAWHYTREHYPDYELYAPDGSHPSPAGSYLAACCFYSVILRKDPTLITFDFSLLPEMAEDLRNVARLVVYDSLAKWNVGKYDPIAQFSYSYSGTTVTFINQSQRSSSYYWNFGDGNSSEETNPVHTYAALGNYPITLVADNCLATDSTLNVVEIPVTGIGIQERQPCTLQPNPTDGELYINPGTGLTGTIHYQIFDLESRLKKQGKVDWGDSRILVSDLPSGLYIIRLSDSKNNRQYLRFVRH